MSDDDFVRCDRAPYGWVIEYTPATGDATMRARHSFTPNDSAHDLAYVMQRAADLHGIVIPLYRQERRK